jgi:hypothetical protein
MDDRQVITSFVAFLAANGRPGLKVDRWPEDEKDGEIDAVAGDLAIEHTSIDTLPDQRRDGAWVSQFLAQLEEEITPPRDLYVVFDNDAVRRGQDWDATRDALRRWLQTDGQKLTGRRSRVQIPGVPFPVDIFQSDPAHLPPRVFFCRYAPSDATLPQRIKELCDRKIKKLARHKAEGRTTILLIENDDIANMNHHKLAAAVRDAYPDGRPSGVDQVWYASTAMQPQLHILDISEMWHSRVGTPIIWPSE